MLEDALLASWPPLLLNFFGITRITKPLLEVNLRNPFARFLSRQGLPRDHPPNTP